MTGNHFYWVEAIDRYNPAAYRILISAPDRSHTGLRRYDPEAGDGPLYHDPDRRTWYRNGNLTGEFLIDEDLWLSDCEGLGFENHNARCRTPGCPHREKSGIEAGAELMARLAVHGMKDSRALFLDSIGKRLNHDAESAWLHLRKSLKVQKDARGEFAHDHPAAQALLSAILDRYGWNRRTGQAKPCNLFQSTEELRLTLTTRIVRAFRLPSADTLDSDSG